jgi:hypothetical protein
MYFPIALYAGIYRYLSTVMPASVQRRASFHDKSSKAAGDLHRAVYTRFTPESLNAGISFSGDAGCAQRRAEPPAAGAMCSSLLAPEMECRSPAWKQRATEQTTRTHTPESSLEAKGIADRGADARLGAVEQPQSMLVHGFVQFFVRLWV